MNVKKLICSIGFILLMATFTNAKLVGYWQMDESSGKTANDRLGDKPATLIGDAKFEPDSGKFGGAVRFGPKGDLVKILGYKGICGKSPRTVSAWVKAESPGTIFSWGNPMIKGGLWEILAKLMVNDGTSDAIVLHLSVMPGIIQGTTPLIDGKWHHIAVVLKESQSPHLSDIVLYVDGKEEIIDVMRNYSIDTKEERFVWIGYELKGLVDEVAIFDNSLNQAEITQLYKQRALSFIGPESQKVVEVISKAKALMEKQEYGRAVKLLQINIVELRQKSISKPNKKNVLLSQLSNLYFQLAIAKEAAGLAESEYVED
ncbi:MAG: LamG domain-containing protein, partial [Planctomycetes bacterium]|nr:LamG domain-containing protein [Planctomycetota bacterium]